MTSRRAPHVMSALLDQTLALISSGTGLVPACEQVGLAPALASYHFMRNDLMSARYIAACEAGARAFAEQATQLERSIAAGQIPPDQIDAAKAQVEHLHKRARKRAGSAKHTLKTIARNREKRLAHEAVLAVRQAQRDREAAERAYDRMRKEADKENSRYNARMTRFAIAAPNSAQGIAIKQRAMQRAANTAVERFDKFLDTHPLGEHLSQMSLERLMLNGFDPITMRFLPGMDPYYDRGPGRAARS